MPTGQEIGEPTVLVDQDRGAKLATVVITGLPRKHAEPEVVVHRPVRVDQEPHRAGTHLLIRVDNLGHSQGDVTPKLTLDPTGGHYNLLIEGFVPPEPSKIEMKRVKDGSLVVEIHGIDHTKGGATWKLLRNPTDTPTALLVEGLVPADEEPKVELQRVPGRPLVVAIHGVDHAQGEPIHEVTSDPLPGHDSVTITGVCLQRCTDEPGRVSENDIEHHVLHMAMLALQDRMEELRTTPAHLERMEKEHAAQVARLSRLRGVAQNA